MSSMRTSPHVESCLIRMPIIAMLLMTAGASAQPERSVPAAPTGAMVQPVPPEYGQPSQWDRVQAQIGQPTDGSIAGTISQWRALQQSDGLGFAPYASFIMANVSPPHSFEVVYLVRSK